MAREKKGFRKSKAFTLPLAPVLGIASMLGGATGRTIPYALQGNYQGVLNEIRGSVIGVHSDGRFDAKMLIKCWTPVIIGVIVHWLASKVGLNRTLARAGVPIIRI